MAYHVPVLLTECIDGLAINPQGTYVDVTYGGGGHSAEILKQLDEGKLVVFDQDEDARANAPEDERLLFVQASFRHLKRFLKLHGIQQVDGILADLGISSHQIDVPQRGFSTRFEGPLDMRMDMAGAQTAADILNTYDQAQLQRIFGEYGEVRNARTLAQLIVQQRQLAKFETIEAFKAVVAPLAKGNQARYFAQVFQALRIEVNEEIQALKEMLQQSAEVLKPAGRLVVISYHSLEDRLVKRFMQKGVFEGEPEKDEFGRYEQPLQPVNRKPILPTAEEQKRNPRSRSAKLRVAEKI